MKTAEDLMSHATYVRVLKPELPAEFFRPNPKKLLFIAMHFALAACGYLVIKFTNSVALWTLMALIIGHSFACLSFYGHDLSHRTILSRGILLGFLETFVWAVVAVPATMWRRVHNASHHLETNTVNDPDRHYLQAEKNALTIAYSKMWYPNCDASKLNLLIWLHFPMYIARNTWAALAGGERISIVPYKPKYTTAQKWALVGEVILILSYQVMLFFLMNHNWAKFAWASPITYGFTSTIVLIYIITNHTLNPLCEHTDPVAGSTSVSVPRVFDVLHSNFSYHTEHHLFPGMDSSNYPKVASLLKEKFPERYNRMALGEAWRRLWKVPRFLE